MEYGSAETGPLAYQEKPSNYYVFTHHRIDLASNGSIGVVNIALVTSLYPRAIPLFRYNLGDFLKPLDGISPMGIPKFKLSRVDAIKLC